MKTIDHGEAGGVVILRHGNAPLNDAYLDVPEIRRDVVRRCLDACASTLG
jgi:hypothetical protein